MASQAARPLRTGYSRASQAGSSAGVLAANAATTDRRRHLLLKGVPRTVLTADIHRALKDAGAVDSSFSLDDIIAEPPYMPTSTPMAPPTPSRTFHITARSVGQAIELKSFLYKRILFPGSKQTVDLVALDRKQWSKGIIDRAAVRVARAGQHMALTKVNANTPQPIDVDWLLKPGFRGRRVLITGLPGKVARSRLEVLASGCEMQNLTQIPPHPRSLFSAFILTFPSVALAYKFHRKVHMTHYDRKNWNAEFLIRSEVQW